MTLSGGAAPECQLRDCDADADAPHKHPQFGEIQVCSICATLFDAEEGKSA